MSPPSRKATDPSTTILRFPKLDEALALRRQKLRIHILALFCALTPVGLYSGPQDDPYGLAAVREAMRLKGFSSGFLEKQIDSLGDSVGIAFLKIYSMEQLRQETLAKEYLPVIRAAFSYPRLIARPEDRKPDVTLLLLRSLSKDDWNNDLKKEAADLISFLEAGGQERPERK